MKSKSYLLISIISTIVLSLNFLLIPLSSYISFLDARWYQILTGLVFWISLIVLIISQILLSKKAEVSTEIKNKIGLITFFKNRYSAIVDIVMFISFILLIIFLFVFDSSNYVHSITIALSVFSFCMHCILNGKHFNMLLKEEEKKK